MREMARATAHHLGHRVIFAPMLEPQGIGNGTHIHFSLRTPDGSPAMRGGAGPHGLSDLAQHFVAGLLHHLPALAAITAPSVASYFRLTPNRWAPTWCNLGYRDRGASVRICPVFAPAVQDAEAQFNIEYRVADATASPYMALGALVHAGVDGVRRKLRLPPEPSRPFWDMTEDERVAAGARPLPHSLEEALAHLAATEFGSGLVRSAAPRCVSQPQTGRDPRSCGTERRRRLHALRRGVLSMAEIPSREVEIDPARAALLFIDVQNYSANPEAPRFGAMTPRNANPATASSSARCARRRCRTCGGCRRRSELRGSK